MLHVTQLLRSATPAPWTAPAADPVAALVARVRDVKHRPAAQGVAALWLPDRDDRLSALRTALEGLGDSPAAIGLAAAALLQPGGVLFGPLDGSERDYFLTRMVTGDPSDRLVVARLRQASGHKPKKRSLVDAEIRLSAVDAVPEEVERLHGLLDRPSQFIQPRGARPRRRRSGPAGREARSGTQRPQGGWRPSRPPTATGSSSPTSTTSPRTSDARSPTSSPRSWSAGARR